MKDNYDLTELTKRDRKRLNSRNKGNTFERKVCSILNKRFETDEFSRSPGSGAFATTHKLPEHLKIYGDIITPEKFKFCIECKKGYNEENISSLFISNSNTRNFLDQAELAAKKAKKEPMLIWQQDRKNIIVFVKSGALGTDCNKKLIFDGWDIYNLETILPLNDGQWYLN